MSANNKTLVTEANKALAALTTAPLSVKHSSISHSFSIPAPASLASLHACYKRKQVNHLIQYHIILKKIPLFIQCNLNYKGELMI